MDQNKKPTGVLEWRVSVPDGSTKVVLVPESGLPRRALRGTKDFAANLVMNLWSFLKKSYELGADDPRKFIHCLKVGMALTIVSLFYYMRPLYEGFGGNAMWAVMTVVVVFENSVGATIYKSLNRIFGTTLAGFLAIGVHWVAMKCGQKFEPLVVGISVFSLASAATFSRFLPKVKEMFDYGAMIFILTFSLVAVSGYRVDKLFDMAHRRISTIIVGTSLCILVSMLICPIWAGQKLHSQICLNMEKLASSLDGYVIKYFNQDELKEKTSEKGLLGYICVLNSKAAEESMATFARWEPAHGSFNFKHPWNRYIKIGASMRNCAYCIEGLRSCISTEDQAPDFVKNHISRICRKVSSNCSIVVTELAKSIKNTRKSSDLDLLIEEMRSSVQELQTTFKSLSNLPKPRGISQGSGESKKNTGVSATSSVSVSLMEIIPAATLASLLIEMASRVEGIAEAVKELANMAEFKDSGDDKFKQNQAKGVETVKALHRV